MATEPDWLTERRRKGAALASELPLPTQKDKGWEFTDLAGLDLDAYAPGEGRVEGLEAGVDPADGPPVVLPLARGGRAPARPGRASASARWSPLDDPFVARNEAALAERRLSTCPAGSASPSRSSSRSLQDEDGPRSTGAR